MKSNFEIVCNDADSLPVEVRLFGTVIARLPSEDAAIALAQALSWSLAKAARAWMWQETN